VVPFIFWDDARLTLRDLSNAIAGLMLFCVLLCIRDSRRALPMGNGPLDGRDWRSARGDYDCARKMTVVTSTRDLIRGRRMI
jgi:hypothetical protein